MNSEGRIFQARKLVEEIPPYILNLSSSCLYKHLECTKKSRSTLNDGASNPWHIFKNLKKLAFLRIGGLAKMVKNTYGIEYRIEIIIVDAGNKSQWMTY